MTILQWKQEVKWAVLMSIKNKTHHQEMDKECQPFKITVSEWTQWVTLAGNLLVIQVNPQVPWKKSLLLLKEPKVSEKI